LYRANTFLMGVLSVLIIYFVYKLFTIISMVENILEF